MCSIIAKERLPKTEKWGRAATWPGTCAAFATGLEQLPEVVSALADDNLPECEGAYARFKLQNRGAMCSAHGENRVYWIRNAVFEPRLLECVQREFNGLWNAVRDDKTAKLGHRAGSTSRVRIIGG